jgi:hypothetical protein
MTADRQELIERAQRLLAELSEVISYLSKRLIEDPND